MEGNHLNHLVTFFAALAAIGPIILWILNSQRAEREKAAASRKEMFERIRALERDMTEVQTKVEHMASDGEFQQVISNSLEKLESKLEELLRVLVGASRNNG